MALDKITTAIIADDAIDATKIATNAVDSAEIAADAVGTAEIANDASISTSGNIATTGSGTLTVAGTSTLTGNTTITGTSTLTGNATASGNLTVTGDLVPSSALSHRNVIINGAMNVAQRGTTALTGSGGYPLDRWTTYLVTAGAYSWQQVTDSPNDFQFSLKFTTTTADASTGAGDAAILRYVAEGNTVSQFAFGTADAKTVTLSFYVKSSLTGQFGASCTNAAQNRSKPFLYTINDADTWERKEIVIVGDTTGTWPTDNSGGLRLNFSVGTGSNFYGTANTWEAATDWSTSGETSVLATLNATWQITGIQLELGSNATPFEHRSYGEELQRCERYFQWLGRGGSGRILTATNAMATGNFMGSMRAAPTIALNAVIPTTPYHIPGIDAYTVSAIPYSSASLTGYHINITKGSGGTVGDIGHVVADNLFSATSEL